MASTFALAASMLLPLVAPASGLSVPQPRQIEVGSRFYGGGLTILAHNDLDSTSTTLIPT
jgi:hypothetical protein